MGYVHHVPGRLRISRWAARHRPDVVAQIRSSLEGVEGVRLVKIAPSTGSLIVEYCRRKLSPNQLENWLSERGHWPVAVAEKSAPVGVQSQRLTVQVSGDLAGKLGRRLAGMIVEKALERLLIAALA